HCGSRLARRHPQAACPARAALAELAGISRGPRSAAMSQTIPGPPPCAHCATSPSPSLDSLLFLLRKSAVPTTIRSWIMAHGRVVIGSGKVGADLIGLGCPEAGVDGKRFVPVAASQAGVAGCVAGAGEAVVRACLLVLLAALACHAERGRVLSAG